MSNIGSDVQPRALFGPSSSEIDESPARFEELAMPVFDSLYNFARWMSRDSHDAEDLVQETYLKALRGFASFQTGTNFRAWMFRILKNTFLSSRSRLGYRMTDALESDEEMPLMESEPLDDVLMKRVDSELVLRAMDSLPAHFREVLILCEVEEMMYREIAETLSIPIGTVMSRLARARKALRHLLIGTLGLNAQATQNR
ncbi:MAG TPA: sigma-70 family RNA polymerase sigma factor [Candidatus Deferrimicrobiaceae bacterium]|jgi:RNA polymerase sigma-70 factor (ECF subfamily)|nr:sigma-70 family RNA polymerase sigma factor [Candidatus Deferrimicrobiaceae bacterium]